MPIQNQTPPSLRLPLWFMRRHHARRPRMQLGDFPRPDMLAQSLLIHIEFRDLISPVGELLSDEILNIAFLAALAAEADQFLRVF